MVDDELESSSPPEAGDGRGPSEERVLKERLLKTEAELKRIYGSAEWRQLHRWRRLQVEVRVLRHRLTHPYESLRVAASHLLPVKWRLAMLRVLRSLRKKQETGPTVTPEAAAPAPEIEPEASEAARPTILCLPVIEWSFRRQRPQHLLERLAARGWDVLYANLRFAAGADAVEIDPEPVAPGVRTFTLPSAGELKPGAETLNLASLKKMASAVARLRASMRIGTAVVLCHSPFWRPLAHVLKAVYGWPIVYDRMDLHTGFSTTAPELAEEERRLIAESDLIVATSQALASDTGESGASVLRLPNACDPGHWEHAKPSPELATLPRPVVGYFGAIADWFDTDLVATLAMERPAWSFVLIGSTYGADTARLEQLPNVHLLGERSYDELPDLAAAFDVGIIPRRRSALTDAMDPVKLYEMLALGLDVVASPTAELETHGDLIRIAAGPEQFLASLEDALRRSPDPAEKKRRTTFATTSSWNVRADRLEAELRGLFPLVSIGIVTYNNLQLTRLCLTSVEQSTEHPNYEIVVVDNGSTDGTRAWLEEESKRWANLRVVLNDENRGFAAACNQAFQTAHGDILCFLNNDTVVTRGWLSAMVRALVRNPRTGMVGPSSNGVANEARVEPGYGELGQLEEWASDFVWEHDGEDLSVPMLALYCAALKREVWGKVGGLDERFETGMFEDDDYSKRLRQAGYELRCLRDSYVHHWQQASFGAMPHEDYLRVYEENRRRYREKWRRAGRGVGAAEGPAPAERRRPVYDSSRSSGPMRDALSELRGYLDLLWLLIGTNVKTRYKRSFLGVAWTLLNPLGTMIVMTIAFSALFKFSLPDYPVYVLAGLVFWTFFQQSTTQCMTNLVWGSSLLKKVYIPSGVFPLAAVGTALVNLMLSLVPILLIMVVLRHSFSWALFFLPFGVLLVALFSLGLGLVMSSMAVFFSDVVDMYDVFLRIWFYLTPVMYPEQILPKRFVWIVKLNPMYHFMLCWREPIYHGALPPLHSVLVCCSWSAGLLLIGWWVFSRQRYQFALRA